MFRTILASTGVGSAKINLILDKAFVKIGQTVTGKIVVNGGSSEQSITGLNVLFRMLSSHAKTLANIEDTIKDIPITKEQFVIKPNEERVFPFSFSCPQSLPVSSATTKYFFDTNLEIKWGRDSHDQDFIDVWPIDPLKSFLESFTLLGFKRTWDGLTNDEEGNWLQWNTYKPSSHFSGQFEEVMFCIEKHNTQKISGYYQVDLSNNGQTLLDAFHLDEKVNSFHFSQQELSTPEQAKDNLYKLIKQSLQLL